MPKERKSTRVAPIFVETELSRETVSLVSTLFLVPVWRVASRASLSLNLVAAYTFVSSCRRCLVVSGRRLTRCAVDSSRILLDSCVSASHTTGGYRYRGEAYADLIPGAYVFADYVVRYGYMGG